MNDFSELENELKKLRPAQPSREFLGRVEQAMADLPDDAGNIIHPSRFKVSWLSLGLGLAAAAILRNVTRSISSARLPESPFGFRA